MFAVGPFEDGAGGPSLAARLISELLLSGCQGSWGLTLGRGGGWWVFPLVLNELADQGFQNKCMFPSPPRIRFSLLAVRRSLWNVCLDSLTSGSELDEVK